MFLHRLCPLAYLLRRHHLIPPPRRCLPCNYPRRPNHPALYTRKTQYRRPLNLTYLVINPHLSLEYHLLACHHLV